jgi:hypothetical protein
LRLQGIFHRPSRPVAETLLLATAMKAQDRNRVSRSASGRRALAVGHLSTLTDWRGHRGGDAQRQPGGGRHRITRPSGDAKAMQSPLPTAS